MLDRIKALFSASEQETIDDALDTRTAAVALMVDAAAADGDFSDHERSVLLGHLRRAYDLPAGEAEALLAEGEKHQADANHLLRFTRQIKDGLDEEQRIELMEAMWMVALADGTLDPFEDRLIRKLGGLIYVSDRQRGEARARAERKLAQP